MKEVITVNTSDKRIFTIFTKHITHIEHAINGCIIHLNSGDRHVGIATDMTWAEFVNVLALK
jgi:hypothetical protein